MTDKLSKEDLKSLLEHLTSKGFRHILRARPKVKKKDSSVTYMALEEDARSIVVLRPRWQDMGSAVKKAEALRGKLGPSFEVIVTSEDIDIEVFDLSSLDLTDQDLPEIL